MMDRPDNAVFGDMFILTGGHCFFHTGEQIVFQKYNAHEIPLFFSSRTYGNLTPAPWDAIEPNNDDLSIIQILTDKVARLEAELEKLKPERNYQCGDVFSIGPTSVEWIITSHARHTISATCLLTGASKPAVRVLLSDTLLMMDIDRVLGIGAKYLGHGATVNE